MYFLIHLTYISCPTNINIKSKYQPYYIIPINNTDLPVNTHEVRLNISKHTRSAFKYQIKGAENSYYDTLYGALTNNFEYVRDFDFAYGSLCSIFSSIYK